MTDRAAGVSLDRSHSDDRSAFDDERFKRFVAPTYLAKLIANEIQRRPRAIIVISGEGGAGKSWLCRGLERSDMLNGCLDTNIDVLSVVLRASDTSAFKPIHVLLELSTEA